jgi:hypothetical protein
MQASESEESECSEKDSSSSCYQASTLQSPLNKQIKLKEFKMIVHCTNEYRDAINIIILDYIKSSRRQFFDVSDLLLLNLYFHI